MTEVAEIQESKSTESKEVSSSDTPPKIPPWQRLLQARESHELTQADIAKELKLDLRFVKALERGELDQLPQPVYTAGYIRAYAKIVGLPPDEIVGDYASQESTSMPEIVQAQEKIPSRYRHVDTMLPKSFSVSHESDNKSMRLMIIILAAAVMLAIGWQIYTNTHETDTLQPLDISVEEMSQQGTTASQEQEAQGSGESQSPEQTTIKLEIPGQSSANENKPHAASGQQGKIAAQLQENAKKMASISLSYSEDSWIDIRDATGKPLIRRLGKAGGSNTITGVAPFEVLLGYSPGVSIEYNGEPYDISAFQSRPVARFLMNPEKPKPISTPARSAVTGNIESDKAPNYGTVEEE